MRIEPAIEVEEVETALELAARGFGDTLVTKTIARRRTFRKRLELVPFAERLYDTFALITRRDAHLSTATRVLVELAERHVAGLAKRVA